MCFNKGMKRELPNCVWIICNGHNVEMSEVLRGSKDMVTLKIISTGQGTRLRKTKVYRTEQEAVSTTNNQK